MYAGRSGVHMMAMRKTLCRSALIALFMLCPSAGAQDNPLLLPPPGLPGLAASRSPLEAERGRLQADSLRSRSDLSLSPAPDPLQRRDAHELGLDADRALRALQDPLSAGLPDTETGSAGPHSPRIDPPSPRITHGRKKGAPTPVQSSPVPDHKADIPPGP